MVCTFFAGDDRSLPCLVAHGVLGGLHAQGRRMLMLLGAQVEKAAYQRQLYGAPLCGFVSCCSDHGHHQQGIRAASLHAR